MVPAKCHPERKHKARGLCNACYHRGVDDHTLTIKRHIRPHHYQHDRNTRLEAAIARWGTPHKAAEQTDYPFADLWKAWLHLEAAIAPVDRPGQWRTRKKTT